MQNETENLGCESMGLFQWGGAGDVGAYYVKGVANNTCMMINNQTGYSVYARDDYKRCVCDNFGDGEKDCPQSTAFQRIETSDDIEQPMELAENIKTL